MSEIKTVFPKNIGNSLNQTSSANEQTNKSNGKAIMGFLYSVSKTDCGEFWPLYVGSNTIGNGSDSSICLKEKSVSKSHANIVVRKMQKNGEDNGIFVFIQDSGSENGTMLNGVTLDLNPKECKNGDIITIGVNYELYFISIDPNSLGLYPKKEFKSMEAKNDSGWISNPSPTPDPNPGMNAQFGPKGTNPGMSQSPFDSSRKTTMYMPNKKL